MRLENYILRRGLNPNTVLGASGDVYGSSNFEDGAYINTSRVVEHVENEYIIYHQDDSICLGMNRKTAVLKT